MAEKSILVRVMTPTQNVLEQAADSAVLRCIDGEKGILPGHEPCALVLGYGMMDLYQGRQITQSIFVLGGVASVRNNTLTVLTEMAGGRQEVEQSLQRVEVALAERKEEEQRSDVEIHRAEVALRSALVNMQMGSYALVDPVRGEANETK